MRQPYKLLDSEPRTNLYTLAAKFVGCPSLKLMTAVTLLVQKNSQQTVAPRQGSKTTVERAMDSSLDYVTSESYASPVSSRETPHSIPFGKIFLADVQYGQEQHVRAPWERAGCGI